MDINLDELLNLMRKVSLKSQSKESISKDELKAIIKEAIQESNLNNCIEPQKKMTLTIDECVEESGIGRSTILELVHAQNTDFPYFRVGKKIFVNRDKLTEWLNKITEENRTIGCSWYIQVIKYKLSI